MLFGSTVQFQCSMQIQEATQMLNSTNILPAEGWNTKRSNEAYKCATHVRADISPCRMIIEEVHFLIFRGFRIRDNLPAIPDYDFCMLHFFSCSLQYQSAWLWLRELPDLHFLLCHICRCRHWFQQPYLTHLFI